jgi:quercetin dioxygenase-like cupin family protein
MPFIHPEEMNASERLPGWHGRHWHSESISFARYAIDAGSSIHEHHHPHEEVWIVVEGELEVTIGGETKTAGPSVVAIVPPDVPHSVRARTKGSAVVANHPVRHEF